MNKEGLQQTNRLGMARRKKLLFKFKQVNWLSLELFKRWYGEWTFSFRGQFALCSPCDNKLDHFSKYINFINSSNLISSRISDPKSVFCKALNNWPKPFQSFIFINAGSGSSSVKENNIGIMFPICISLNFCIFALNRLNCLLSLYHYIFEKDSRIYFAL